MTLEVVEVKLRLTLNPDYTGNPRNWNWHDVLDIGEHDEDVEVLSIDEVEWSEKTMRYRKRRRR